MKVIKRKMVADEQIATAEDNINEYLPYCQASFNSDGNITLRNYDRSSKDEDEIIILSNSETQAVFKLMSELDRTLKNYTLPF